MLGPHALGAAGGVHGHVAAADDGGGAGVLQGGVVPLPVGLHQVDTGQVLVGGVHPRQGLAGDAHKHGQARAGTDEHGLIALLKHFVNVEGLADDHIGLQIHAQGGELVHLVLHDGLGQAELGDAVHQHAAGGVEGLEDGDLVAVLGQIAGAGQAGGAGAHHRHLDAIGLGLLRHGVDVLPVPIGHKALQPTDGHRLALDGPDAPGLTLALLRADTTADAGQGVGVGDNIISGLEVALGHFGDKLGDADVDRAAAHAGLVLAVEAACRLFHSHLLGVA